MRKQLILLMMFIFTLFLTMPSLFAENAYNNTATDVGVCQNLEFTSASTFVFVLQKNKPIPINNSLMESKLTTTDKDVVANNVILLKKNYNVGATVLPVCKVNYWEVATLRLRSVQEEKVYLNKIALFARNIVYSKLE